MGLIKTICSVIFMWVGIITLCVGMKFLKAKVFFPYHKEASGMEWKDVNEKLQVVILAIMRMAGFGILCLSIMMIFYVLFIFNNNNIFIKYSVPIISLLFWCGSFGTTFKVHKKTNANTPWKGSLFCVVSLLICILLI